MACADRWRRLGLAGYLLASTQVFAQTPSALRPAGPAAAAIAEIGWVMFIGGGLILLAVMGLLWRALRQASSPASSTRRWRWIAGGGLVFPIVVLAALAAYSQWRSQGVRADPPADALVISVTGRLWWWEVRYRDPAGGPDIVLANEIRVPVGKSVVLGLASADVIHSAWIPTVAGKMDLVPGRINRLVFSVDAPGVHRGQCAEFCGEQHARMALHLVAQTPDDFAAWLRAQAAPAKAPTMPLQAQGLAAFLAQRCNACHNVRGVSEGSRLGPDLTHVASRVALGAGTLDNGPANLVDWIAHLQRHKPGAQMPSYDRLDPATLEAIGAYLGELR